MDLDVSRLEPHPLALLYDRDEEGLIALAASIAAEGMRDEVVVLGNQVVDGNRRREAYRMAVAQGAAPPGGFKWRNFNPRTDGEVWDFILAKNVRRDRPRGKKALPILREELKRNHDRSDRSICMRTGCHHAEVRDERARMEEAGLIPKGPARLDAKGSRRPAAGPKPPPDAGDSWEAPEPGSEEANGDAHVKAARAEAFDKAGTRLPRHLRDAFADSIYVDMASSLRFMARHVASDPKLYCRLHVKPESEPFLRRLEELAEWAEGFLTHHAPHAVCPDCGGAESGCASCFSTGFLSKGQYEERASVAP